MDQLQEENHRLRQRIQELESQLAEPKVETDNVPPFQQVDKLSNAEIRRFGRQLILPHFGKAAQLKLRNTSILVVGAGGLGSPACLYLGAGGVGRLGIVDHDTVDISNLHRQVIHTQNRRGMNKAVSAMMSVHAIYPDCEVIPYTFSLDSSNALDIIKQYDIVVDATDNVATRYLLSDACVIAKKPLVSGSALRYDGQLTIYNYNNGPCYRCLHPVPPPADSVSKCSDTGVLGVVPGVIGTLEALEAIKIAIGANENEAPSFLIFSALSSPTFRTMRLRNRKKDCEACGDTPTITKLIDYVQFCGASASDQNLATRLLKPHKRVSCKDYNAVLTSGKPHLLLDVRPEIQYDICALPNSWNIPIDQLQKQIDKVQSKMQENTISPDDVFIVCRLGNDSQLAVRMLEDRGIKGCRDIIGGLFQWSTDVDASFPVY
ncbi:adenylyltransferase [Radiomyces spectabilis]|uniref:adenylyltransferase n=1 Tax=Radiomyces spectabilis TaxID=64574 RepID=UPI00221EDB43|nr:adenylyltransferase [Radiomyces spectabilis]KAI8373229.1 adenylyltransferase [Radiomyces spectabilis]